MKDIFVIHENGEIITARDTMSNAIAAGITRIGLCGYTCESFDYGEFCTVISYRDYDAQETRTMFIEGTTFKEGV